MSLKEHKADGPYTEAIDVLRDLGLAVHAIDLPRFPYGEVASFIWQLESWSVFEPYVKSGELEQALVNNERLLGWRAAALIPSADYIKVMRIRRAIMLEAFKLYERFDVLLAPMNPLGARPIEPVLKGQVEGRPTLSSELLQLGGFAGHICFLRLHPRWAAGRPQLCRPPHARRHRTGVAHAFERATPWCCRSRRSGDF